MRKVTQVILLLLIILALFTVFTLSTFKMGATDNSDYARAKAEQLRVYAKVYSQRHDGERVKDLSDLASYAEDGARAIVDPWGNQFQFRYVIDSKRGKEQFVVWTVSPSSGKVIAAPPEAAEWIGP